MSRAPRRASTATMGPSLRSAEQTGTQSIGRAISILWRVAEAGQRGRRLTEIARDLDLNSTTAYRMLSALTAESILLYRKDDKTYRLGPSLISLATIAHSQFALRDMCQPALDRIAVETHDTVFLHIRCGSEAICVGRAEGTFPIRTSTLNIGDRRPLGVGGGGLAILAFLDRAERENIVDSNGQRYKAFGLDIPTVKRMVTRSREYGFAVNEGKIVDQHIYSVGFPLADNGSIVAAISIAAISSRMSVARYRMIADTVRTAVAGLPRLTIVPQATGAQRSRRKAQSPVRTSATAKQAAWHVP